MLSLCIIGKLKIYAQNYAISIFETAKNYQILKMSAKYWCLTSSLLLQQIQNMKQIYHLATCQTCKKALAFLNPGPEVEVIEIKSQGITPEALDKMAEFAGSYEALFSRRAQLYKKRGLAEQSLTEQDYRSLILEHYTFLKRPVILTDTNVFAGHAKATLEAAKTALSQ